MLLLEVFGPVNPSTSTWPYNAPLGNRLRAKGILSAHFSETFNRVDGKRELPRTGLLARSAIHFYDLGLLAIFRIAVRLRSTSSSVVAQFETLIRIAVRPRH